MAAAIASTRRLGADDPRSTEALSDAGLHSEQCSDPAHAKEPACLKNLHPNRRRVRCRPRRPDHSGSGPRQREVHPHTLLSGRTSAPSAPAACASWRSPAWAACCPPAPLRCRTACPSPPTPRSWPHYRRIALEFLFSERNHQCAVCVSNNHCELQAMAQRLGVTHVRYPYNYPQLPVDVSHPRYVLDHNRCISARAACASAPKWKARTSGTSAARGIRSHDRLRHEPALGRNPQAAPIAASACRSAPPARWPKRDSPSKKWSNTIDNITRLAARRGGHA